MSKLKNLLIDIEELLEKDHDPVWIAGYLKCPVNWVYAAEANLMQGLGPEHYDEYEVKFSYE